MPGADFQLGLEDGPTACSARSVLEPYRLKVLEGGFPTYRDVLIVMFLSMGIC